MTDKTPSSILESKTKEAADSKKEEKKEKDQKEEGEGNAAALTGGNTSVSAPPLQMVVVHPLVLLSVVDHYTRVAKDTEKRVVGVLLGETHQGKVDVTNSYAVPFEEDPKDSSAWYVDRQYHEDMFAMFKKVNASEKVIGWYSTGPKIKPVDMEIHEMFRSYTSHPVLVIIDVNPHKRGDPMEIPTQAYMAIEAKPDTNKSASASASSSSVQLTSRRQFAHLPSEIGAYEAEEVGVEHLLRNIRDSTDSSLTDQVQAKIASLRGLKTRLTDISLYVANVCSGKLPVNHTIVYHIQDMFNLMPDLSMKELVRSFAVNTHDNLMQIYLSSLIRSIVALHDLINNKLSNKQFEADEGKSDEQKKAEKAKREKEAAEKAKKQKEEEEKSQKKSNV